MAYSTFRRNNFSESAILHPRTLYRSQADQIKACFTRHRPYYNEFMHLNEMPPETALTLAQWSSPSCLRALLATYSDYIWRDAPGKKREDKPLISLWAQWYTGLLVPPLMLALLTQPTAPDIHPQHIYAEFHETGRASAFWFHVQEAPELSRMDSIERLEALLTQSVAPVVQALEETGHINSKLIWSNLGYVTHWFFNELSVFYPAERLSQLRTHFFLTPQLRCGSPNPLFRTVLARNGGWIRRTCCQRNRLPGVQQCGDCTLG